MDRREFLKAAVAAGLLPAAPSIAAGAGPGPIPRRELGKTGEKLSIIGLGGIVVMGMAQKEADRTVRDAIARGVNYFDVAPSYGNGEAEEKLGPALKGLREKVFLACKTANRDRDGAAKELEQSLKRLGTDHFDLYQLHAITTAEDVDKALAPGGAIETFEKARKDGKVRFLGFSAHSVEAALSAMERFRFDTILFPFNFVCFTQGDFGPQVLKAALDCGMGCLAMKAMAANPWPADAERTHPKCWYQPVTDPAIAELALRFTLSEKITAAIPPGDERLFRVALAAAQKFKPLSRQERERLVAKAKDMTPIFRHGAA